MSNTYVFFGSLIAMVVSALLLVRGCDVAVWMVCLFLFMVSVPLLFFSAYRDYHKP